MAETTVFPGGNQSEAPLVEQKKPVGRPRKDGQPAGTAPIAGTTEPEDFFLMLPSISEEEWQFRMLYLYRLYPITDRRGAGQPVYLSKFSEPVDRERVMRDYGSGIYKLELLQTIPNERGKKMAACMFQIMNQDYPPKVPAGEWVNDPRNADWEWCRPKLGPGSNAANGSASAEDVANAVYAKVHQNMPQPKDEAPALLAILAPLLDPKRQTDMMLAFANMLPKPAPPAAVEPKEDKSLALLMQMLMDDRKALRDELIEIRKTTAAVKPEKSWLETAIENEELMKRIFGKSGPTGPQLEGWAAVFDKGIDKLGSAIAPIAPVIAARLMAAPPQQRQIPPTTVVQATPAPLPAPADQPAPQQQQQQPAPQQTEEQMKAMELWSKYGNPIMQSLPFIADQFKDYDQTERPGVGYDCRDWFLSPKRFGNVIWEGLRTEVGVDGFMQIAKQFPDVWKQFQPEEKFKAFLSDFFTPVGEERPDEFGEDDEELEASDGK